MKSFYACDNTAHEGLTNTWFTPQEIITTLGTFDLDPCTQTYRPYDTATRHICEDAGECGLASKWEGRVWLNPPYGKTIGTWLERLVDHGNEVALVFSRTETIWAQTILKRADAVNFIAGRISFLSINGKMSSNAANGSMLLAFGEQNVEAIKRIKGTILTNL
jgi:hypothetical protein